MVVEAELQLHHRVAVLLVADQKGIHARHPDVGAVNLIVQFIVVTTYLALWLAGANGVKVAGVDITPETVGTGQYIVGSGNSDHQGIVAKAVVVAVLENVDGQSEWRHAFTLLAGVPLHVLPQQRHGIVECLCVCVLSVIAVGIVGSVLKVIQEVWVILAEDFLENLFELIFERLVLEAVQFLVFHKKGLET